MKKLIFLGTNSILERYIDAADRQGQEVAGIIDSDWYGNRESFAELPILDSESVFNTDPGKYRDYVFFVGTNWNPTAGRDIAKRKMLIDIVNRYTLPMINLIDPTAYIGRKCQLGQGIFIGNHAHLEPFTVVKDFAVLSGHNGIGHNSEIGSNTIFQRYAGIYGKIGHNSFVGQCTNIYGSDVITVGDNVTINSFLHVARNVNDNETVSVDRNNLKIYRSLNKSS